jgi:hypothetical protein
MGDNEAEKATPRHFVFVKSDILDPKGVCSRLKDASDPFSKHLTKRFRPETRKLLDDYDGTKAPGDALSEAVFEELNGIAAGPLIFDAKAFRDVEVSEDTRRLLDSEPKDDELARLNAMLIENAFPTELLRNVTTWPKVPAERVQTGVRLEKRMLKVLKGMAEYGDMTLGELLEDMVLHAFEGVSTFDSQDSQERIEALKKVYGMDYDGHAADRFVEVGRAG